MADVLVEDAGRLRAMGRREWLGAEGAHGVAVGAALAASALAVATALLVCAGSLGRPSPARAAISVGLLCAVVLAAMAASLGVLLVGWRPSVCDWATRRRQFVGFEGTVMVYGWREVEGRIGALAFAVRPWAWRATVDLRESAWAYDAGVVVVRGPVRGMAVGAAGGREEFAWEELRIPDCFDRSLPDALDRALSGGA